MTDLPTIRLQPGRDKRVAAGHPWIFSNEIAMTPDLREVPLGAPVRVESANGKALGVGGFNRHALIAVRMLHRDPGMAIDTAFLR
ncbi:MAG TPA: RlmI/RlmK family 23S rRNA methyltransferase, partial [Inquilinus sp.]|nr:RlmI/RlmK family 23S rRNA methyltransferase [Inquilinus sp.]